MRIMDHLMSQPLLAFCQTAVQSASPSLTSPNILPHTSHKFYHNCNFPPLLIILIWGLFWSRQQRGLPSSDGYFCIWYVRLDFQYICDVIILMFNHAQCPIDKWHIAMTSHTRHGISTQWQLYCLLNNSFRQTWNKTPSRLFTTGDGIAAHWTAKAPLQWLLATGILWWPVVSPHTGPATSSITEWHIT